MVPSEVAVLVVGLHDYGLAVAKELRRNGVQQLTLLDKDEARLARAKDELGDVTIIHQDPMELHSSNPDILVTPQVVVALDQPRDFEVTLDTLRWQNADAPFVISRCSAFACKFRSAYHTIVINGQDCKGNSLLDPVEPFTDEKKDRMTAIVKEHLSNEKLPVYLAGAAVSSVLSVIPYFERTPSSLDNDASRRQVETECNRLATDRGLRDILPQALHVARTMCGGGYTQDAAVVGILAQRVAYEVLSVAGGMQPLNVVSVEQVFNAAL